MPIYLHPANFIFNKLTIENYYQGGMNAFREKYINELEPFNQEDNHLFSISRMNPTEFDFTDLLESGLNFNMSDSFSNDFTVYIRYTGLSWNVDWLINNSIFAWHINSSEKEIDRVIHISNLTFNEVKQMQVNNENPLNTIRIT